MSERSNNIKTLRIAQIALVHDLSFSFGDLVTLNRDAKSQHFKFGDRECSIVWQWDNCPQFQIPLVLQLHTHMCEYFGTQVCKFYPGCIKLIYKQCKILNNVRNEIWGNDNEVCKLPLLTYYDDVSTGCDYLDDTVGYIKN